MDFGLTRVGAPGDRASLLDSLTPPGTPLGTWPYMAPEQADDSSRASAQSDLFSLGCVLYEAATGRRAFDGSTTMAVLRQIASENPTAPAVVNPAILPALSDLIVQMLAKDPEGRPASAGAVADTLRVIQAAGENERDEVSASWRGLSLRPHRRCWSWTFKLCISLTITVAVLFIVGLTINFRAILRNQPVHKDSRPPVAKSEQPENRSPAVAGLNPEPARKDPDRAVAQWALQIGAKVVVRQGTVEREVIAKLPEEPFRLIDVDFRGARILITDAELKNLSGTSIIGLNLRETNITDAGLDAIAELPLSTLHVDGVRGITDVGVERIGRIRNLRHLYLDNTTISDEGLAHLARLNHLLELTIKGTKVTEAGVQKLKSVLRDRGQECRIEDDWPGQS
jgi:hypothetical protein